MDRHEMKIDPPQQPLICRFIQYNDFTLMAFEGLHSLIRIVGMLDDLCGDIARTEGGRLLKAHWGYFLLLHDGREVNG